MNPITEYTLGTPYDNSKHSYKQIAPPKKKKVLSDHEQAIKINDAFDKRQRKNRKRAKS